MLKKRPQTKLFFTREINHATGNNYCVMCSTVTMSENSSIVVYGAKYVNYVLNTTHTHTYRYRFMRDQTLPTSLYLCECSVPCFSRFTAKCVQAFVSSALGCSDKFSVMKSVYFRLYPQTLISRFF